MPTIDPIGLQSMADPVGMSTPSMATAPIGTGVMPPPNPAQVAQDLNAPISGVPSMPVLPPPTISQKLIQAGLAMISADQEGMGLGGALGAGMQAYNGQLQGQKEEAAKSRAQQLAEYEIMGRIADRHNTELAMQKKIQAGQKIKAAYPQYADLYDADPEAAIKLISEKVEPKSKFEKVGDTLYKIEDGKDPVPYGANGQPLPPPDPNAVDGSGLSGQAFLDTLNPQRAAQIKAFATGKFPINKRSKTYNQDMQDVLHYDNTADEQTLKVREQAMKEFASSKPGTAGGQIIAANTGIGHGIQLIKLADNLKNKEGFTGATLVNYLKNAQQKSKGNNPAIGDYNTLLGNFVDETGKFYKPGGDSQAEREQRLDPLKDNNGPTALKDAIKTQIGSYMAKLDELDHAYKQGVDPHAKKYEFLDKNSRKALADLGYLDQSELSDEAPSATARPSLPSSDVSRTSAPPMAPSSPVPGGGILDPAPAPLVAGPPATPKTKADFDKLKTGALFINPKDGQILRKK